LQQFENTLKFMHQLQGVDTSLCAKHLEGLNIAPPALEKTEFNTRVFEFELEEGVINIPADTAVFINRNNKASLTLHFQNKPRATLKGRTALINYAICKALSL